METINKYFTFWWLTTSNTTQIALSSRFGASMFLLGKLLRFVFFLLFLILIGSRTQTIAGYTLWEIIFFFATFNIIDTIPQFFMREVYRFRHLVVSGDFDYILLRPMSPLFRALFGGSDILDIPLIVLSIGFVVVAAMHIAPIVPMGIILYILLLLNAMAIAFAFHVFVVSLGILTTEVDSALWIYRDITQMGRLPVTIYQEPLKSIITFAIPVGIMITFPAQALMGLLSFQGIIISLLVAAFFVSASLMFWKFALKRYSSASS